MAGFLRGCSCDSRETEKAEPFTFFSYTSTYIQGVSENSSNPCSISMGNEAEIREVNGELLSTSTDKDPDKDEHSVKQCSTGEENGDDVATDKLLTDFAKAHNDGALDIALSDGIKRGFWSIRSFRHGLTWVLCMVMIANTWSRNTLSMAMVCMVNATAVAMAKQSIVNVSSGEDIDGCGGMDSDNTVVDYGGDITWTSAQQGLLFSAIYWGGAIVGLPSGWLINRYGSKRIVTVCLVITLICTLTTPVAAQQGGLLPTFFVRFIMGFGGQVVLNIAITVIMSQWIPPAERSTVLALYTSGNQIAVIVGMPVNAALCKISFMDGWPSIFYFAGFIVLGATILWHVFVDDTPAQSRWLSKSELQYIEKALKSQSLGNKKQAMKNVPWRRIFTSGVMWSCTATNFAGGLVAATLQSYIPTYFKQALKMNLESNGLFSALPFIAQWVSKMVMAVMADAMKKHTKISHTVISKVFNTIGTIVSSAFLVGCAFMGCNQVAEAILLLSLANTAFSGLIPGAMTALVSFAPAYTGIVNGISRFSAQIASIVAPYIVGVVTRDGTPEQWRIVFFIMAGFTAVVGVSFIFCGTVKIQDWAKLGDSDDVQAREKNQDFVHVLPGTPVGQTTEQHVQDSSSQNHEKSLHL